MNDAVRKILLQSGMNVDKTLERFGDCEELFMRYLLHFPEDPAMGELEKALKAGDAEAMMNAVHTLKGVSGNLGLQQLYESASWMVATLRTNPNVRATQLMVNVQRDYNHALQTIEKVQRYQSEHSA